MRIAITGAAGMIGGAVAERLARDGHELVLFDRRPADRAMPGTFVVCDGRDRAAIDAAIRGAECVCHIGEVPNIHNAIGLTPLEVKETNVAICRAMLDASIAAGVRRMIYTSSCQYYGYWGGRFPTEHLPSVWPIDERQPAWPQNAYAESKAVNEIQCATASHETLLETIRFRFPWVIGQRQREHAKMRWAKADVRLDEGFWTYLDLRDAVEAYVAALSADRPFAEGAGRSAAFHFVADGVWGEGPIREKMERFLPHFPQLPADWASHRPPVSCAKAGVYLGWRAMHRFDQSDEPAQHAAGQQIAL